MPPTIFEGGKDMPDKTIKHFVFSRFFSWFRGNYPYDIFDVDFLSTQLPLTKNMLSSLENQTNKDFEVVFLFHPKVADNPKKYELIFSMLKDSTTLPLKFVKKGEETALIKDAVNEYDFLIQTRMDFDDFIFKDAVADTQSKVNVCENILAYGYCRGYKYICKELNNYVWKDKASHLGIFQSLIMKSSYAKNLPPVFVFDIGHNTFKLGLKRILEKNSIEFSENMFQQNTTTNAYIYFKHEFSAVQLIRLNGTPLVPPKTSLTTKDITKKQLEEEFGFFYELKSIK